MSPLSSEEIIGEARRALDVEIRGLQGLQPRLDASFVAAVREMFACKGRIVVAGMGKSGHIGTKIAATLASTGTPALFLHPGEAIHGDLGMVTPQDLALVLSNSGHTEEVLRLLGPLRRMGVKVIAMTGNVQSELAKRADLHLDVGVAQEACPLGLAPTASTTAALAMGDTLAVCLLRLRNFKAEDYALFHPGGSLGKKLMTVVADIMETGDKVPVVPHDMLLRDVIPVLQDKHYGVTCVVDGAGRLAGSFSMGDLTRLHLQQADLAFLAQAIERHMHADPKAVAPDLLAARALHIMETHHIRALFVVDEGHRPVGIIGLYETLRAVDY
ncbi:MAG: KpsF/GutQ family sugar-phosphate isomerase [Candidatus Lambdaproteobacteria bacterium]|nr:KpsF/GutQ family sugar-phosphate isomerase [Candidatus Lambdaproteobacteria bacterium]